MGPRKATAVTTKDTGDFEAQQTRIVQIIEEFNKKAPEKIQPAVRTAAPFLASAWIYFLIALPYILKALEQIQVFLTQLPEKIIWASLGFIVCFFGGIFPATIAAIEAWHLCGGQEASNFAFELIDEFKKIQDASKKDDDRDDDKDGKQDVSQLTPSQLVQRKLQLVLKTVEPERISTALVGLYTGWIGVLAILKVQFARTVTLGEVIGQALYKPASHLEPALKMMIPEEYHKWIPVGVRWACKTVAISTAWWLQRVISAFHSAIRGGQLFGRYLVAFLHEKGYLPADSKDTYVDEAIGWIIAALGFLTQFAVGFHVPFLFNIFLWPFQLIEAFVVWSVNL